ncbi:hypothetical protein RND71_038791 [Anisodus tanguticus]|uniref:Tify domain-containing protein n=1 Tax=Anisodus tanguticus TaxID=243964 RepID=A0AAE1R0E5_9SOLA|nr:hypothetical protein RND71_038791 [Anisodus tanguticus]
MNSQSLTESPVLKTGTEIGIDIGDRRCFKPDDAKPESNGSVHGVRFEEVAPVRNRDTNGVIVYRRNKRLKSAANVIDSNCNSGGKVVINDVTEGKIIEPSDSKCNSGGKVVINDVTEGKMVEIEVKEESTLTVNCATTVSGRRFTRSVLKLNVEPLDMSNENLEVLDGKLITCGNVHDSNGVSILSSPIKEPEMEMSKKISIIGRPTTVKELFETGLLEGYPVFYNGGKRLEHDWEPSELKTVKQHRHSTVDVLRGFIIAGIPLRGTVNDIGILCSCDLCKGARVVPPCKFEIHACKTYRRASQYICLENGKSLLDVVKECRKGSLKQLEATIRSFIGPIHVKENIMSELQW